MDRNSLTGFILICLLSLVYFWYTMPTEEQIEAARQKQDSIALLKKNNTAPSVSSNDNSNVNQNDGVASTNGNVEGTNNEVAQNNYGTFFKEASSGTVQQHALENDLIKIDFSNIGGRVDKVELKNFKTYDKKPLVLLDSEYDEFGYEFFVNNYLVKTNNLFFKVDEQTANSITYKAHADEESYILQKYTLRDGEYMMDYDVQFVGMDNIIPSNNSYINLKWKALLRKQEKLRDGYGEMYMTSVFYKDSEDEVEYCDCNKTDDETLQSNLKWVGFKQQFFNQTLIAKDNFTGGKLEVVVPENEEIVDTLKYAHADLTIPYRQESQLNFPMQMYYGPNDFSILKSYDLGMQDMIPLGGSIFRWFNQWMIIPLFNFLNKYITSYGIIILILTLMIKALLFPLTYKTYQSAAKMNVLKPDIAAINAKYKDKDKQKAQMETMQLYRKAGVNPAGGCLPTILQMPILFAMYRFFPASIELRQQPFLWADDLSTYDSILELPFNIPLYGDHVSLFTILMALSSFLYMRVNSQMTPSTNEAMAAQMKIMQNFMPIMFLGIFNSFAAGLTYYFFLSNLITYLQQFVIKKFFINEDKLKAQIASNKTKVRKKSKFQKRLEDLQKQSEQMQRERQKGKKRRR